MPNEFRFTADEKKSDTVFQLEDGSILMLEYESNNRFKENHLKYMRYGHRILQRYFQRENNIKKIYLVVVYTSDVTKVLDSLDAGSFRISSNPVLLSEYNGDAIMENIKGKIRDNVELNLEELYKLSFVPLMYSAKGRNELTHETVELAKCIKDEHIQLQVIAGILTSTDKFIDNNYAIKVREWLKMTKVGRLFEEGKQEAVAAAVKEAVTKVKKDKLLN